MKSLIYFCSCIVIFNFTSCSKENNWFPNTTVHGRCTNYCTGEPIENVQIYLVGGDEHPRSSSNKNAKTYRTVFTDSDGYYEIKFSKGGKDYWLETYNSGGYRVVTNSYNEKYDIKSKGDTEINFPLTNQFAYAWVKLNLKNTSPFDNNDRIDLTITQPNNPLNFNNHYISNHYPTSFTGLSINGWFMIDVAGCSPLKVQLNWTVTKNGIVNNYSFPLVCTADSTLKYNLEY